MANAVAGVEPLVSEKTFKYSLYLGVALMLIAGTSVLAARLMPLLKDRAGENLPEQFDRIQLPACPGCWRVKLSPNQFSGRICFPPGRKVNIQLDWENKDSLFQIRNKNGKVFTIDPKINNDLGIADSNEVLQFKGNGYVRVKILRIWGP